LRQGQHGQPRERLIRVVLQSRVAKVVLGLHLRTNPVGRWTQFWQKSHQFCGQCLYGSDYSEADPLFGERKLRYRALKKNRVQLSSCFR
jgi:hypothetical protein